MRFKVSMLLVSAACCFSYVQAHEVGVLVDKQFGVSQALGVAQNVNVDAAKPTGFGVRGAFTLLNLGVAELGVTGTYHFEAKDDLVMDGQRLGSISNQYWAIGAQADWKLLLNLHGGIELRHEIEKTEWNGGDSNSTTLTRPWICAGVGFSMPFPVISPFVRLEAAYALQTYSLPSSYSADDLNQALAPKFQVGLYGGIRF